MARPRRKDVIRDGSGIPRGELPEIVMGPALAKRAKIIGFEQAVVRDQRTNAIVASNALAGHTLGILLLRYRNDKTDPSAIDEDQYLAGSAWSGLIHRNAQIQGYEVKRNPGSPSFTMVGGGRSVSPDADPEIVQRVTRQITECFQALRDVAQTYEIGRYRPGTAIGQICYAVCVENLNPCHMTPRDYGNLRVGLNALGRVLL